MEETVHHFLIFPELGYSSMNSNRDDPLRLSSGKIFLLLFPSKHWNFYIDILFLIIKYIEYLPNNTLFAMFVSLAYFRTIAPFSSDCCGISAYYN